VLKREIAGERCQPTSASWLNLVERFFAEITTKRIRRGVFRSVAEFEDAIHDYLDRHNAVAKPFVWTKTADVILALKSYDVEQDSRFSRHVATEAR
jgi:hypothetical protein